METMPLSDLHKMQNAEKLSDQPHSAANERTKAKYLHVKI